MTDANSWDTSYLKKDNFLFYPHEEVIRFVSKYIRKRIGMNDFTDAPHNLSQIKVLDAGCGIGRHVKFLIDYNLDGYGIDFSKSAIEEARLSLPKDKLLVSSIDNLPFEDKFFNFVLSHGVFDSMPFEIAKNGMKEVHRCLTNEGLFYLDIISGDDSDHAPEFNQEEVVKNAHEFGTTQSYFNWSKIEDMLDNNWKVLEAFKVKRESVINNKFYSRYHLILKKS